MKNATLILTAIALLGLASCSEVEQVEPIAEQNVITTDVNIQVAFDHNSQESIELDINNDGTIDFRFFAKTISGPGWGDLAMVGFLAAQENNQILAQSSDPEFLCQIGLPMSPGKTLTVSEDVDPNAEWASDAMLYGLSLADNGCEEYKKYMDYGPTRYVGVRFDVEGTMIYGWVKLIAADTVDGVYPESADIWRISQFGYSDEETTLRIPA